MSVRRVSSAEASQISDTRMAFFDESYNRKIDIKPGQYYAIIADSPDRGVIISDKPIEGFAQATSFCRVGRVSDMESTTCVFYSDRTI